jgi:peptide/nickel transport system substrate-binding protein
MMRSAALYLAAILLLGLCHPARAATLTIAQSFDPQELSNTTTTQENLNAGDVIVEPLFWADPRTGKTMPVLAESFDLIDPVTVRLHIRQGVSFTNGEKMNADAVVHSFRLFLDPKLYPGYANYAAAVQGVEKTDDFTVVMHMKYPYAPLEVMLGSIFVSPPVYWNQVGLAGFARKPIGTGPFRLTEWVRDDHITMDRNPTYWGTAPAGIDRLVWKPVPDDTARAAGMMTGEYDIASNIPISALDQLKDQKDLQVIQVPSYRIFRLILSSIDMHPGPLHDKRVRQAFNYAIDKQAIIDNLFGGHALPLHGQNLRPDQLGYDPTLQDYPYDPAKAKALLTEAGFPNGFEIQFKFPSGRYAQDREVSEAIAGMLAKIGVRTRMVALEAGEFLRQLNTRELGPLTFTGSAPPDDPDFQESVYRSTWRYSFVNNPQMDALIDAGNREMDKDKRAAIYRQLMQLMHEEVPLVFLYQAMDLYAVNKKVQNFLPRGDQRFTFYGVSLK